MFGRLRKVKNTTAQAPVAEYKYNGLGFRISVHEDTDQPGGRMVMLMGVICGITMSMTRNGGSSPPSGLMTIIPKSNSLSTYGVRGAVGARGGVLVFVCMGGKWIVADVLSFMDIGILLCYE